jgi:hypothetical protein
VCVCVWWFTCVLCALMNVCVDHPHNTHGPQTHHTQTPHTHTTHTNTLTHTHTCTVRAHIFAPWPRLPHFLLIYSCFVFYIFSNIILLFHYHPIYLISSFIYFHKIFVYLYFTHFIRAHIFAPPPPPPPPRQHAHKLPLQAGDGSVDVSLSFLR